MMQNRQWDPAGRAANGGSGGTPRERRPRVIAIGGGKGGIGKTLISANLSAALARLGSRVVAIDTDLEGANLHTALGMSTPTVSLADYVADRERDLRRLLLDTPIPGLRLIAATHANLDAAQPKSWSRVTMLQQIRELPADYAVVDLGAGTQPSVIDYFLVGDVGVLVMTPEPTSVENAYAFLRAAFYRRLRHAVTSDAVREIVNQAMDQKNDRGIRTPLDLMRAVRALSEEEGTRFVAAMRAFRPQIVVNGARTAEDIRLGFTVRSVCRKYFGLEADYLGYVNWDDAVSDAVRSRSTVIESHPRSDASIYVTRIARKLAGLSARPARPKTSDPASRGSTHVSERPTL